MGELGCGSDTMLRLEGTGSGDWVRSEAGLVGSGIEALAEFEGTGTGTRTGLRSGL